jgi:hypothetical protein
MQRSFENEHGTNHLAAYFSKKTKKGLVYHLFWITQTDVYVSYGLDPMEANNHTNSNDWMKKNYRHFASRQEEAKVFNFLRMKEEKQGYTFHSIMGEDVKYPDNGLNFIRAAHTICGFILPKNEALNDAGATALEINFIPGVLCPIW